MLIVSQKMTSETHIIRVVIFIVRQLDDTIGALCERGGTPSSCKIIQVSKKIIYNNTSHTLSKLNEYKYTEEHKHMKGSVCVCVGGLTVYTERVPAASK